jgi:hypothetical protein
LVDVLESHSVDPIIRAFFATLYVFFYNFRSLEVSFIFVAYDDIGENYILKRPYYLLYIYFFACLLFNITAFFHLALAL